MAITRSFVHEMIRAALVGNNLFESLFGLFVVSFSHCQVELDQEAVQIGPSFVVTNVIHRSLGISIWIE